MSRKRWLPIEKAPQDGTFILACASGPWNEEYLQWRAPRTISFRAYHPNAPGKKCWRDSDGKPVIATHYLPLSALPTAPQEGGAQ